MSQADALGAGSSSAGDRTESAGSVTGLSHEEVTAGWAHRSNHPEGERPEGVYYCTKIVPQIIYVTPTWTGDCSEIIF